MILSAYVVFLVINFLFSIYLAKSIWKYRSTPGSVSLGLMVLSVGIWSIGFAFEILTPTLAGKNIWVKWQYLGILMISPSWLTFVISYIQPRIKIFREKWRLSVFYLFPLITFFVILTNDLHGWFTTSTQLVYQGEIPVLNNQHNFWFWLSVSYEYALIAIGAILFGYDQQKSLNLYQLQARLVLVAISLPLIINMLHVFRILPGVYLFLFSFNASGALIYWALYKYQFLRFLPIAHQEVMDSAENGVIIIDKDKNVTTVNKAARKLFNLQALNSSKKDISLESFPKTLVDCITDINDQSAMKVECELDLDDGTKTYEVSINPLRLNNSSFYGWLLFLADISDRKEIELRLLSMQTELEQRVEERTKDLQRLAEQRKRLFEISLKMISTFSFDEVVALVMNTLQEIMDFSICVIYWLDAEGKILVSKEIFTKDPNFIDIVPDMMPIDRGITGSVARTGTARLTNYATQNPKAYYEDVRQKPECEHLASVPLFFKGKVLGVFQVSRVYDVPFTEDEFELIQLFASQANAAIQNARLFSELEDYAKNIKLQREQMRLLASRVEKAREMEQLQLAQELHDQIGQNLTALIFNLNILEQLLPANCSPNLKERLNDSTIIVRDSVHLVRDLLAGLRPSMLDDRGVFSAIKWYAEIFSKRAQFSVKIIGEEVRPRLDIEIETALFRIAQEALNNAAKHADAQNVRIELELTDSIIRLIIEDDGKGFDYKQALNSNEREHWGLITMQERAYAIGGDLLIESFPEKGTTIEIVAPLQRVAV